MGILDRFSKLLRSNANAAGDAVGKLQDPAKEVELLVVEMEDALRRARQETAASMAAEKLARNRLATAERELPTWGQRAETALGAGDEDLAREALKKGEEAKVVIGQMQREVAETARTAATNQEALRRLEARLREVKAKKATISAKVALNRQQGLSTNALDEFQRMADRIDDNEAQGAAAVELEHELSAERRDDGTEAKLARLGGGDVDARLAALKAKLPAPAGSDGDEQRKLPPAGGGKG